MRAVADWAAPGASPTSQTEHGHATLCSDGTLAVVKTGSRTCSRTEMHASVSLPSRAMPGHCDALASRMLMLPESLLPLNGQQILIYEVHRSHNGLVSVHSNRR